MKGVVIMIDNKNIHYVLKINLEGKNEFNRLWSFIRRIQDKRYS